MRKVLGALRRADERFNLIQDGDRIAVGLSGGKDSMLLLYALVLYKRFSKKRYGLHAVCVDLGFGGYNTPEIRAFAEKHHVPFHLVRTQIAEIVFDIRKEKNPCSLCAKMRKGALYEKVVGIGCNKAAFAHHADDMIETFIMSLMYEARVNTFSPKTFLSRRNVTLVRPFVLLREDDIRRAVRANDIPIAKNPCPIDHATKRDQAKEVILYLNSLRKGAGENIFTAICNTDTYNLWNKEF
jgi:tRNA(Ile)-lysidine synthase TilS/MesJ